MGSVLPQPLKGVLKKMNHLGVILSEQTLARLGEDLHRMVQGEAKNLYVE